MTKLDISPELLDALQTLSSLLESENGLQETLNTVVQLAVVSLAGCDSAGITLRNGGQDTTAAASDAYTLEIDKIQYGEGQGPCVTAMKESAIQQIEVMSEETRWPDFCRLASEHGLRSVLSLPMNSDGMAATLNLYAKTERAFDASSVAVAEVFANQTTIALRNAQTYAAARDVALQLNEALKSRDMIGQAKGILMEREGISDEAAFEMLRTLSQNSNVKLRDVAYKLIEEQGRSSD